jgi:hypothetical protein
MPSQRVLMIRPRRIRGRQRRRTDDGEPATPAVGVSLGPPAFVVLDLTALRDRRHELLWVLRVLHEEHGLRVFAHVGERYIELFAHTPGATFGWDEVVERLRRVPLGCA